MSILYMCGLAWAQLPARYVEDYIDAVVFARHEGLETKSGLSAHVKIFMLLNSRART